MLSIRSRSLVRVSFVTLQVLVILSCTTTTSGLVCKFGDTAYGSFIPTCTGDICIAQRSIFEGIGPVTQFYCLDKKQNPQWREECDGLFDRNTTVSQCCLEERCNAQLAPRLPEDTEAADPDAYPPYRPINDTFSRNGLQVCTLKVSDIVLEGHSGYCYGKRCSLERLRLIDGSIRQIWGCLNNDTDNIAAICSGLENTEESTVQCCFEYERCNDFLHPKFPSELITTTTMTTATNIPSNITTSGDNKPIATPDPTAQMPPSSSASLDMYHIIIIVLLAVVVPIILGILIVTVGMILWKNRQSKEVSHFKSPPLPTGAESPVSIESDSSDRKLRHSLV